MIYRFEIDTLLGVLPSVMIAKLQEVFSQQAIIRIATPLQVHDMELAQAEVDALGLRYARLNDEQMKEIEDERPGEEFCTAPWLY